MKEDGELVADKTHICDQAPNVLLKNNQLVDGNYIIVLDAQFSLASEKEINQRKVAITVSCPEEVKLQ